MTKFSLSPDHLTALANIAGEKTVISPDNAQPMMEEWRGRWQGESPLVLAPKTVDELSQLMAYAYAHDIPMVPQGGNTGLVGGQTPKGEILISTKRMRNVRDISPEDFTMTLEAGVTLT
ncbi:MAG: FAD-binding oxidoreductase, partial [Pseudomonadota bacterium]